ncbi:hypothetical protein [Streptomyces sp. NPDC090025]|uniref:hypothetical protein n=1 Tax=Streptomyces sp. NPDC090025 TaxID=3365922 RepID=UPI00383612FA
MAPPRLASPHSKSDIYGVSSTMSNTDTQEQTGSGKHRGPAAPAEDSSANPHGRHRRDPDGQ